MKKLISLLALSCFFISAHLSAQIFLDYTDQPVFKLNPVNESIQIAGGLALTGSALICDKVFHIKENDFDSWEANYTLVPYLEQFLMAPYNKALHYVGTGTAALALLTPAVFILTPNDQWLTIGLMYTESLLWAYGIKEWGKLLIHRARPYMYFDNYPLDKVQEGDWNCSFPSGHTTLAFTGAAYTTFLFHQYFPDSPWRFAVTGISFGIAAATGALRMASGNHFLSDVLTGAIIGTVCGVAVPFMHTTEFYKRFQKKNKAELYLSPLGFNAKFYFN